MFPVAPFSVARYMHGYALAGPSAPRTSHCPHPRTLPHPQDRQAPQTLSSTRTRTLSASARALCVMKVA